MKKVKDCKGIALVWLILIIVLIIVVLGVGVIFLLKNNNNEGTSTAGQGINQESSNSPAPDKKVRKVLTSRKASFLITENNDLYAAGKYMLDSIGKNNVDYTKFRKIAENVEDVWISDENIVVYLDTNNTLYSIKREIAENSDFELDEYNNNVYKVMNNVREVRISGDNLTVITENNELYVGGSIKYNLTGSYDNNYLYKVMDNVKTGDCNSYAVAAVDTNDDLYVWKGEWKADDYLPKDPTKMYSDVKNVEVDDSSEKGTNIFILTNNDELYGYGKNGVGEFGSWTTKPITEPIKIKNDVNKVYESVTYAIFLTNDGTAYGTSGGETKVGGDDVEAPNLVKILDDVVQVDTELEDCYFVTKSGEAYKIDTGSDVIFSVEDMQNVEKLYDNVKQIIVGYERTLVLTNDGEVYAEGSNEDGILGLGDTEEITELTKIDF